jgi:hypothetical protein
MTNWTLETALTNSDIHFFQKKDNIPEEVLQRYETFRDFFLLNNELTFNSSKIIDKSEILEHDSIWYFDERKKIERWRTEKNC